jgi:hypothetical protein
MTQDEIICMAREAGNGDEDWLILTKQLFKHFPKEMERLAALVAEATKEKAAKVCDGLYKHDRKDSGYDEGWNDALDIADQAIRSMK